MTKSEKQILRKIRIFVGFSYESYDFWFVHDPDGIAVGWEGGFGLGNYTSQFRNQYTVERYKRVRKNW